MTEKARRGFSLKRILFIVVLGILVVSMIFWFLIENARLSKSPLKIHVFNAGKADAALVRVSSDSGSSGEFNVLIDAGEEDFSGEILNYLSGQGIEKLDYLIITHFDKDHVGGAAEILKSVEVSHVLQTNTKKDSEFYENYLAALEEKGILAETVEGENLKEFSASGVDFKVQGPEKIYKTKESNNSSLIVSIEFSGTRFLFMGDAEEDRIDDFLETELASQTYQFLKVPYHGNYLENFPELVLKIQPKFAVITSSYAELEDKETRAVLEEAGAKVFLTRQGSVEVFSDGEPVEIRQ